MISIGVVFMLLSAGFWGLGTVMSKYTLDQLPPVTLLVVQLMASTAVLWIATFARREGVNWNHATMRHGWTGVLEPGVAYLAGLIGLAQTSASNATVLGATEPVFVLVLAWLLLRERITLRVAVLMIAAVVGTILITGGDTGGVSRLVGDMLILAATGSAALYVIFSRNSVAHLHPLPLAALQQTFGLLTALAALPVALFLGETEMLSGVSAQTWGWAALTGVTQYALAFLCYLSALRTLPVTQAALYLTLIPVFGIVGGSLFLGEQLNLWQWGGTALVIAVVVLLNTQKRRQPQLS